MDPFAEPAPALAAAAAAGAAPAGAPPAAAAPPPAAAASPTAPAAPAPPLFPRRVFGGGAAVGLREIDLADSPPRPAPASPASNAPPPTPSFSTPPPFSTLSSPPPSLDFLAVPLPVLPTFGSPAPPPPLAPQAAYLSPRPAAPSSSALPQPFQTPPRTSRPSTSASSAEAFSGSLALQEGSAEDLCTPPPKKSRSALLEEMEALAAAPDPVYLVEESPSPWSKAQAQMAEEEAAWLEAEQVQLAREAAERMGY